MSIKIKKITGEAFDLPQDYTIESEKNNPVFEKKGSQTVPISFPDTNTNKKLLGFPGRLDRMDRMDDPISVVVDSGPLQQSGLLAVGSAGGGIISANIGFDESEIYNRMKEMQLRDIPDLPVVDKGGSTLNQRLDSILSHLNAVMKGQQAADYAVFPIVVKTYTFHSASGTGQSYEILNNINTGINTLPTGVAVGNLLALEERTLIRADGNEPITVSVPKGYGVTAFLKVAAVLDLVFGQYSYTVLENPFKTHRQLKKLAVLNNTIDAVLTGRLYYKDMMPDITVQEFLDILYAKFGTVWFVDSNKKTVSIKFLKDIIKPLGTESIDLTSKLTGEPAITYSPPKQIKLKATRLTLEDKKQSADVLYDTYEELLEKFDFRISQMFSFNAKYARYDIVNIFQFDANDSNNPQVLYSSDFFDWDKKTAKVEYEEIEQKDLCLPFSRYDLLLLLNYSVDFKQAYSDLIIGGEKREGPVNPAKPAFAFGWGLQNQGTPSNPRYFPFASQINRDVNGEFMSDETGNKYDISLTNNREDGLYNRFWKEYDAFIRHSNQEVVCKMHLSNLEIQGLKLHQSVLIKNQPFVIRQIKYKQNSAEKEAELTLRSLRLYEADNLAAEQRIPVLVMIQWPYYWQIVKIENTIPIAGLNVRFIENIYDRKFYEISGVKVPISSITYSPPTAAQYVANEIRVYRYTRKYSINGTDSTVLTTVTVTFTPASSIIS